MKPALPVNSRGPSYGVLRALLIAAAGSVALLACTFDPDDRCGVGQAIYGDNVRCVCPPGSVALGRECVTCGENEIPGPTSCVCNVGFYRPAPGQACEPAPQGLGAACDTVSMPCAGEPYSHCEVVSGTSGYCTSTGCAASDQCTDGYGCDLAVTPSICRRPPLGLFMPCASDADCAGTEATHCDVFFSKTCLQQGCTFAPDSCFVGTECCDLSQFGITQPLCIVDGYCTTNTQ